MNDKQGFSQNTGEVSRDKKAWDFALKVLAASPKSRRDLGNRLREKGFSQEETECALKRLESVGYLNDQVLADGLVQRMADSAKGFGRRKAVFELKKRGFAAEVTAAALEKMPRETETESAQVLAKAVWQKGVRLEVVKRKKKVFDTLIRRGYDYEIAQKCAESLARGSSQDEDSQNSTVQFQDQE